MSVICDDIPNSEETRKAQFGGSQSLVSVRYEGESKIPGIDATKLAPCILPVFYKEYADEIKSLEVYEDDIWVTSFPKSGTTWTQEMVWLIANDLNFEAAKKTSILYRYGTVELSGTVGEANLFGDVNSVEFIHTLPRPRFIKTHLPINILPTNIWSVKPKIVYVTRNPKDVAISFFQHTSNLYGYKESLEDFLDSFLKDLVWYAPYKDHVLGYWKLRNEPNVLFIRYEDMFNNLKSVMRQVATFFNKTYSDDQFEQLAKHLSFNEMRTNKSCNYEDAILEYEKQLQHTDSETQVNTDFRFCRRGQANSAKDEMPLGYQKKFDDWIAEAFNGSGLQFNS